MKKMIHLFVYLEIRGENLNYDMLNRLFPNEKIVASRKGEEYVHHEDETVKKKIRDMDYWNICNEYDQLDVEMVSDVLLKYIDSYCLKCNEMIDLLNDNHANLWCCVYPEQAQTNIDLNRSVLAALVNNNLSVGFTMLYL